MRCDDHSGCCSYSVFELHLTVMRVRMILQHSVMVMTGDAIVANHTRDTA